MDELIRLGARSVPVVSRGKEFVYAQVIRDVTGFLGLREEPAPELSPEELALRFEDILETAIRLVRQMPDDQLENELPNRPRSWRVLMHHIFQIPNAFLDMEESGNELTYESLTAPPPAMLQSSSDLANFGEKFKAFFAEWWKVNRKEDFPNQVPTFFGGTTRHEMLERTVWHTAQHVRQIASLLEQVGVVPDRPLNPYQLRGLPLTKTIWDEA